MFVRIKIRNKHCIENLETTGATQIENLIAFFSILVTYTPLLVQKKNQNSQLKLLHDAD
jgi:hypothetical protein